MKSDSANFRLLRVAQTAVGVALTAYCLLPMTASAQVYRIVGADGKVTFSDKPPADNNAKLTAPSSIAGSPASNASLPFELRQVVAKYPVTLYVGNDCSPCGAAKSMLTSRGVPFTEKTVISNDDIQALQRISGETSLPFVTIGSQQLKGFADSEWTQYLNAAGYPASSALPAGYRAPAASPLVAVRVLPINPAAAQDPPKPAAPRAVTPPPASNPSGIRF